MNRFRFLVYIVVVSALVAATATPAAAQSAQTWVSSSGLDTNPCSRTLPCRTFAWALTQTLPAGEIDALDPGDFQPVTITKAITIDGGPGVAGVNVSTVSAGIRVNAGSEDVVTLRNLSIQAPGIGTDGITILGGRAVFVENCVISGFSFGIRLEPLGGMTATVANTTVHNGGIGIRVSGARGAFFARLTAADVRLTNNNNGMVVADNSLVSVSDSIASGNAGDGFDVISNFGAPAQLELDNTSSSSNGNAGVVSVNVGAVVRLSDSTIAHNGGAGVVPLSGGQTLSYRNNRFIANAAGDGTITDGAILK